MNTKKRILAVLLGFIIFTNVTFNSYRNTYAVIGVDDATVAAIVLCLLTAAGMYVNQLQDENDANQIAQDFLDYCLNYNPSLYAKILDCASHPEKIVFTAIEFKDFILTFNNFFGDKFNAEDNSVVYNFPRSNGVSSAMVNSLEAYRAFSDPLFMSVFNTDTVNFGFNRYVDVAGPDGRAYNSFYRAVDNNSGNVDFVIVKSYSAFGLDGVFENGAYGVNISSSNMFDFITANYVANHSFELLGTLYYDAALSESSVDGSGSNSEEQSFLMSAYNSLRMGVDDFLSKFQDRFETNDLTGEAETVLDPSGDIEKVADGEKSLDDYYKDLTQDKTLASESTVPAYDPAITDEPAVDVPEGSEAVAITNTAAIAASIADTYGKGNINMNNFKIKKDLSTTFPFSLPWDIMRILKIFQADPVAPVFEFDFSGYFPFNLVPAEYKSNLVFRLDLSDFDTIIKVEKFFITMGYALFLITVTRSKMIRG